jgi:hypothetical protein
VPAGTASLSQAFQGQFNSWFLDGGQFLTNQGTTVWTYSNSGVQLDITQVSSTGNLTGQGNWFWSFDQFDKLNVYQVGASGSPALSSQFGVETLAIPSGTTIGVLAVGPGQFTVIDLSGATPTSANYSVPIAFLSAYAETSAAGWLIGNQHGVLIDRESLAAQPRNLTLGAAWSIAGGSAYFSVATA